LPGHYRSIAHVAFHEEDLGGAQPRFDPGVGAVRVLAVVRVLATGARGQEQNQPEKILPTLQQAVQLRPYETPLRARLSQAYLKQGLKQEAITELDALGEMQLEAGMRQEATETIKLIISLSPKNVRAYKRLLDQILG